MNKNLLLFPYLTSRKTGSQILDQVLLVGFGVLALGLLAQLAFPLPHTPVPVTGQTFGVLCLGLLYGRRLGFATIIAYILLGSLGLPLFAKGGSGFLLFSPSGGYLIGYVFAVLICGYLAEKGWTKSFPKMVLLMFMGEVCLYTFGLLQLSLFVKTSVFAAGLYPFILGDLAKMGLLIGLFPSLWKVKEYISKK